MTDLSKRFEGYRKNVGPELLKLLTEATGVSESDLEKLSVGFDIDETAVVFAERAPDGRIISLIRWFDDSEKRSLIADEHELIYITTTDVPEYIRTMLTGNLLQHPHVSFIAKQWLNEKCTGVNGKLTLAHDRSSFLEYKNDHWCELKVNILNDRLWAYLKGKNYIDKRIIQGDWFVTARQYVPTKYKIRQVRWCLKMSLIRTSNTQECETTTLERIAR